MAAKDVQQILSKTLGKRVQLNAQIHLSSFAPGAHFSLLISKASAPTLKKHTLGDDRRICKPL
jgi:hypothetical protein